MLFFDILLVVIMWKRLFSFEKWFCIDFYFISVLYKSFDHQVHEHWNYASNFKFHVLYCESVPVRLLIGPVPDFFRWIPKKSIHLCEIFVCLTLNILGTVLYFQFKYLWKVWCFFDLDILDRNKYYASHINFGENFIITLMFSGNK